MLRNLYRVAAGIAIAAFAVAAQAQAYPSKPITLIVPFAPGASADGMARIIGRELSGSLGQPVVVENKPGAGGALGMMAMAKQPPDGYTMAMGSTGIAVIPHLPDAPPLDPQSLLPLAKLAHIPLVFVTSSTSGYGNLQAFLKAARSTKGGLSYGHAGQYSSLHLSSELLAKMANAPLVAVAYRGSGPAVTDVLSGVIPAAMVDLTAAYPHIKAGKLVALGVTSGTRSKVAPEIPTLAEEGVTGYAGLSFMGLFLPAKTPADIRAKLSGAIQKIMGDPAVQAQILGLAAEPVYSDGPEFGRFIEGESKKWAKVVASLPKEQK